MYNSPLKVFYKQVRCGLFHDGITGKNVLISGSYPEAVIVDNDKICINPHEFLDKVKEDFSNYIADLKNKRKPEIDNFEKMFYFGQD